jgi:hypothetical protein
LILTRIELKMYIEMKSSESAWPKKCFLFTHGT